MSSPPADNASALGGAHPAATRPATQNNANAPSQREMETLMQELDGLLLLEGAEPHRDSWDKLKAGVTQLLTGRQVNVDNHHVTKLTQAMEALVTNQRKPAATAPVSYTAALRAGIPAWSGAPPVREVPTRLA
jgi:hypothetical protein